MREGGVSSVVSSGDLPLRPATVASRSLTGLPRMDNLHSNHSQRSGLAVALCDTGAGGRLRRAARAASAR
jgi:hypothetical protein